MAGGQEEDLCLPLLAPASRPTPLQMIFSPGGEEALKHFLLIYAWVTPASLLKISVSWDHGCLCPHHHMPCDIPGPYTHILELNTHRPLPFPPSSGTVSFPFLWE